jgi:hypothetical protein
MILRKIGAVSAAKIYGVLGVCLGLVVGALFSVVSLVSGVFGMISGRGLDFGMPFLGVGAVVVLPIFYGVGGVLSGLIGAGLYNLVAARIGGLQIELSDPVVDPPGARPYGIDRPAGAP